MLIDTHTHLYMPEFAGEDTPETDTPTGTDAVRRAMKAGVEMMIFPAVDRDSLTAMTALHRAFPDNTRVALGLHPTELESDWREELDEILQCGVSPVAIGEVGIDMYWDQSRRERQMEAFEYQCSLALERSLPLIIHCRDGLNEVLEVLEGFRSSGVMPDGVFHSFGGTEQDVERIRNMGDFYFGINGIVTFKNCKVREVLPAIGTDRIVLETDSPYLAPVPHRGKRNESAYLPLICDEVARSLSMSPEESAGATTANARRLFNL